MPKLTVRKLFAGWKQMTTVQKIGCVIALILTVAYPAIVAFIFIAMPNR